MAYNDGNNNNNYYYNYYSSRYQAPQQTGQPYLNHKVSDLSDSAYNNNDDASSARVRGRESLVSLQSSYGSPRVDGPPGEDLYGSAPTWSAPFVGSAGTTRYQPLSPPNRSTPTSRHLRSFRSRAHDTIHEDESIDMSLLSAAAPLSRSYAPHFPPAPNPAIPTATATAGPPTAPPLYDPAPAIDLTSFAGPMGAQDDPEFLRALQAQEASGKLTGGLGAGMGVPQATIRGQQLPPAAATGTTALKRTFTRTFSSRQSPRAELRERGQNEANRRGEVIEVILEDDDEDEGRPADVDLSSMAGPAAVRVDTNRSRYSQIPAPAGRREVFYPQPNWKPFSMRWPYLTGLILLSIGLAVCQELLYQKSAREPLIQFQRATDMGAGYYFVFKFLPTIVAVTYGVLWQGTDFEVRRLEAFYQLSREGGARAAESLNVDYVTLFSFARPLRALRRGHHAVAVSAVATLLAVSLVPTLSAAAFVLEPDRATRLVHPDVEKIIVVSPLLSRLLSATFVVAAALGCVLSYQLGSRRSGLLSDVRGIAGLASMAVASHIMMDFKDTDVARPGEIHRRLRDRRYALRNSSLVPVDADPDAVPSPSAFANQFGNGVDFGDGDAKNGNINTAASEDDKTGTEDNGDAHSSKNPHPLMLRPEGCVPFIVGVFAFLGFIPVFLFTPARAVTDRVPWVVTALAVCIKLAWGGLEMAVRLLEPYYILSRRHAPPRTLTLDYTAMPFAVVAARALVNRHWMVFLVGWGTVLVEVLTIFVTSLTTVEGQDFLDIVSSNGGSATTTQRTMARLIRSAADGSGGNDGILEQGLGASSETVLSFTVTLALTVLILAYLGIVATVALVRRRRPFLPRQPSTIASVLAFMHQSKMLYDFVGTAKFTSAHMRDRLEGIGKTYGLGWFEGRDGRTHCGIDEEELISDYKHGADYSRVNKPWLTEWQLF
ncbi:hypothetical protein GGS23DRAFT_266900 [Durotheca rogersii]|uniref:uncharacterized protein n=1 Tax=Durotheca rogersii TaxID=419775 RepID=UPI00222000B1|nr:uncharacterized protein GGS23DRAFT_266900 [Durotheca rogersii]KAI5859708.1 hypothetical protein GGS23DRAFT_266900 [Durotheca rogersii]